MAISFKEELTDGWAVACIHNKGPSLIHAEWWIALILTILIIIDLYVFMFIFIYIYIYICVVLNTYMFAYAQTSLPMLSQEQKTHIFHMAASCFFCFTYFFPQKAGSRAYPQRDNPFFPRFLWRSSSLMLSLGDAAFASPQRCCCVTWTISSWSKRVKTSHVEG